MPSFTRTIAYYPRSPYPAPGARTSATGASSRKIDKNVRYNAVPPRLIGCYTKILVYSDPSPYQQVRGLSITSAIDDSTQSADGGTCLPRQLDLRVDWVQFYHGV